MSVTYGDLTRQAGAEGVVSGDELLVHRPSRQQDYRAAFAGAMLLPSHSATDAGKTLHIDSTGSVPHWEARGNGWSFIYGASNVYPTQSNGIYNNFDLTNNYKGVYVRVEGNVSGDWGLMAIPVINAATYTHDADWSLTFTGRRHFVLRAPSSASTPMTVRFYVQQ